MIIYHIALNEYKHYCTSFQFFTDFESVEKWVKEKMTRFGDCFDIEGKSVYELIDEYNESVEKYGIVLTSHDFPNLTMCETLKEDYVKRQKMNKEEKEK